VDLSVFDVFKIGIGPSSSHTVGPMRAAGFLLDKLDTHGYFGRTARIRCELFGSLAVNAARMALRDEGARHVSLDQVMATMRETGRDMQAKYKETSTGGLAINVTEC
jgi:hypothetical protein